MAFDRVWAETVTELTRLGWRVSGTTARWAGVACNVDVQFNFPAFGYEDNPYIADAQVEISVPVAGVDETLVSSSTSGFITQLFIGKHPSHATTTVAICNDAGDVNLPRLNQITDRVKSVAEHVDLRWLAIHVPAQELCTHPDWFRILTQFVTQLVHRQMADVADNLLHRVGDYLATAPKPLLKQDVEAFNAQLQALGLCDVAWPGTSEMSFAPTMYKFLLYAPDSLRALDSMWEIMARAASADSTGDARLHEAHKAFAQLNIASRFRGGNTLQVTLPVSKPVPYISRWAEMGLGLINITAFRRLLFGDEIIGDISTETWGETRPWFSPAGIGWLAEHTAKSNALCVAPESPQFEDRVIYRKTAGERTVSTLIIGFDRIENNYTATFGNSPTVAKQTLPEIVFLVENWLL